MRSPLHTPLGAVFQAEVLFNSKRVAPYALMAVFSANAVLWWGWGPAVGWGWATNSDFYIVRLLGGFSFMTMPLFIAVMMGDPVIRDFRIGIDPLIFSKPLSRFEYLLGKFLGNFFVLVCCQACFALTLLLLQAFSTTGMVVLPFRVVPYFQHFIFFVGVSSLALAALCFTVGTLTRNVKIVYAMMTSFYVVYVAWQTAIKGLSMRLRILLDPFLFNVGGEIYKGRSLDWINQLDVSYDADMITNRGMMFLASIICLSVLYARFSMVERSKKSVGDEHFTTIGLASGDEPLFLGTEGTDWSSSEPNEEVATLPAVALPVVNRVNRGARASYRKFMAATGVELRLLLAERSLVVVLPLAALVSVLGLAYYEATPSPTYSAAYAWRAADSFLLFMAAIAIFYTGEAMHRDRELRIEPVLWGVPAPNFVLVLSKFTTTLLLSAVTGILVSIAAMMLQLYKGHAPVDVLPYLATFALILFPSMAFMIAAATALNVLLRDKYLTYAVCLGVGGGMYYLFNIGYNGWLYNPVLYGLWTPSDLTGGGEFSAHILFHRIYCLALSAICLSLAHLIFERKTTKALQAGGHLSGRGWVILIMSVATALALITGWMVQSSI